MFGAGNAFGDYAVRQVEIAKRAPQSRVPEVTARGRFLAPQAISVVDVSTKSRIGILFDKGASGTRYEENQIEGFATPISDLSKKQNIDL